MSVDVFETYRFSGWSQPSGTAKNGLSLERRNEPVCALKDRRFCFGVDGHVPGADGCRASDDDVLTPGKYIRQPVGVPWNERGVVTSTNMFARSIGSALGVAVFGAIANSVYANTTGGADDAPAIVAASGAVFLAALAAGILTVAAVLAMPAVKPGEAGQASPQPNPSGSEDSRSNADTTGR